MTPGNKAYCIMNTGTVKWFNQAKGYGFIDCDGRDIFVHYSEIQMTGFKSLDEGDKVEFDLYEDPKKGLMARNVKKIN